MVTSFRAVKGLCDSVVQSVVVQLQKLNNWVLPLSSSGSVAAACVVPKKNRFTIEAGFQYIISETSCNFFTQRGFFISQSLRSATTIFLIMCTVEFSLLLALFRPSFPLPNVTFLQYEWPCHQQKMSWYISWALRKVEAWSAQTKPLSKLSQPLRYEVVSHLAGAEVWQRGAANQKLEPSWCHN